MKESFFLGIQRERLAWKVQPLKPLKPLKPFKLLKPFKPLEPCQWFCHCTCSDWEKPWRGQVFGARLCTRNEKTVFSRDSEGAFGMESATPQTPQTP